jgi:hypothetical protein
MAEHGVRTLMYPDKPEFANQVDPAAVVQQVQDALTYQPRTHGGQQATGVINTVAGVIPKVADYAGQKVLEKTGSPMLATEVNTGIQALAMGAGARLPAILKGARNVPLIKPTLDFASEMLPGGANRASQRILKQYAGTPDAAARAAAEIDLHQAGQSGALADKYGMQENTAGVTQNAGLAQLERDLRNQGGEPAALLNERDTANRKSITSILGGIEGTPAERLRAQTAHDFNARTAYEDALNNPEHFVQPPGPGTPDFESELAANSGLPPSGGAPASSAPSDTVAGLNPVGQRLQEVLQRPAMEQAMKNARMQAANRGVPLDERNLIQQLHYAKMDLDDQISAAGRAGNTNTMGGLLDTKHTLLGIMDDLSPAYAQARAGFRVTAAPLNRMDIGTALKNRYMNALQEEAGSGSTPTSFMNALRDDNGDALARSATDFGGAHLNQILQPADLEGIQAIKEQLARQYGAETRGRSVGSPTAQNLANAKQMNNVGSINGITEDMGNAGKLALALHSPALAIAQAVRGAGVRSATKLKLANYAMNPEAAATVLRPPAVAPITPFSDIAPAAAVGTNENSRYDLSQGWKEPPSVQP